MKNMWKNCFASLIFSLSLAFTFLFYRNENHVSHFFSAVGSMVLQWFLQWWWWLLCLTHTIKKHTMIYNHWYDVRGDRLIDRSIKFSFRCLTLEKRNKNQTLRFINWMFPYSINPSIHPSIHNRVNCFVTQKKNSMSIVITIPKWEREKKS